ncbi:hypothetical protein SAMN05443572_10239 [Myxococcus fulvus]|uniref:Uncharacterized protein n=2 Tax=Myxococcus fulvus TaxID=33 RepID=A0A511TBV2_MYXFU|nr:hypothetical protein MFUL124B02_31500 [Myxococcus fulvus 124B02]GEN10922.1 hypothetical protein MFU01_59590 [Myxococcus fulvus]SET37026.1 hypothetical protein SAMN05443572_10239 [Myxococcus fulvus]
MLMMRPRRGILIVVLTLGVIGGFISGFQSLSRHNGPCPGDRGQERWGRRAPAANGPECPPDATANAGSPPSTTTQAPAPGPR